MIEEKQQWKKYNQMLLSVWGSKQICPQTNCDKHENGDKEAITEPSTSKPYVFRQ
jgi:hypothetical protein